MGRKFGEPQVTAALRLGDMFQHGHVPYLGVNLTRAVDYYTEVGGVGCGLVLVCRLVCLMNE